MEIEKNSLSELEEKINELATEYKFRKCSCCSSKTMIVWKLKSFREVNSIFTNFKDKSLALHFLIEKTKSLDISIKIVSYVLFKQFLGTKCIEKVLEKFPRKKSGLDIISMADYFMSVPEKDYEMMYLESSNDK